MRLDCKRYQIRRTGFTLIEMIGVLAIIAILVAAVAPRIFEAIEDSKVTSASTLAKSIQVACTKYYADMGTLQAISDVSVSPPTFGVNDGDPAGVGSLVATLTYTKAAAQTAGAWPRFRGPYLESFSNADAPIGTAMRLANMTSGVLATNDELNYDLTGDGIADIGANTTIVSLVFSGISGREWEKIDAIIDAAGLEGKTEGQRQLQGRVKYDVATQTLFIYIAHK